MLKGENLQVLNGRMKTMNPDENQIHKFLGVQQVDGIKMKEVYNRVKDEVSRRVHIRTRAELNYKNLVKSISTKVIPVASYPNNVCKSTQSKLVKLDQVIKKDLKENNMLGRQVRDEWFYTKRRGLKSLREVYEETRLCVGCFVLVSDNNWIKEAWKQETRKESNSFKDDYWQCK